MSDDCISPCDAGPVFPRTVWNRPGLPRVGYRIGTWPDFRQEMLAGIDRDATLAGWTHREPDDPGIALLEGAAMVGDVLTFYQELYANEAYLRTAQWRESVGDLVRLVGYRLLPGVGGRALFAIEVKGESPVTVPAGFQMKAELEDDTTPTDFETEAESAARPALGRFNLYGPRSATAAIPAGTWALEFHPTAGIPTAPALRPGDRLMLLPPANVFNQTTSFSEQDEAEVLAISRVETVLDRTVYHFERPTALSHAATVKAVRVGRAFRHFGLNAPPTVTRLVDVAASGSGDTFVPAHQKVEQGSTSYVRWLRTTTTVTGDYASLYSSIEPREVPLDTDVGDLPPNAKLVCQGEVRWTGHSARERFTVVRQIQRVRSEGWSWGMTSATTAVALLTQQIIRNTNMSGARADLRSLRFTEVLAELTLRAQSDGNPAAAAGTAFFFHGARGDAAALAGRTVILRTEDGTVLESSVSSPGDPSLLAGDAAEVGRWPVSLAAAPEGLTGADFDELAPRVTVYGNVVEATQGKREREAAIGSGDARKQWQTFKIPKAPLTYLSAPAEAPPVAPELEIWVGGRLWTRVESFFDLTEHDEVYIVREDLKGESWVQFGDGKTGRRLPSGVRNVVAVYRTGTGAHGALKEGKKVTPGKLDRVTKVHLPGVATGGAEPEEADNARKAAPGKLQSLDRLVSLADYEAEALSIPGVTKARAAWGLSGGIPSLLVTVLMEGGREEEIGAAEETLRGYDFCRGPRRHPLKVIAGTHLHVALSASVAFDPTYRREDVEIGLRAALGVRGGAEEESEDGLFSLARRTFGEAEYATRAEAAIQNVPGVLWTRVTALASLGESNEPETLSSASAGLSPRVPCGSAQVLRLYAGHLAFSAVTLPAEAC